ncbi:MAG TPA: hypothetical protein VLK22_04585 [Candidatus Udaeobacter sp.]|nr:hypothetical protein [Candidatus Udaeobacter sp.]
MSFKMVLDIVVRSGSIAILLAILHQVFFSKGGSSRHNTTGAVVMGIGILLTAAVFGRAAQQDVPLSKLYITHLVWGGTFLLIFFFTGFLGWKAKTNPKFSGAHRYMASTSLVLLALTLFVGIMSWMSH